MRILIVLIIAAFLCGGCDTANTKDAIVPGEARQIDSLPSECPFLTKDEKGNTVLSWLRKINDSTTAFCYATSADGVNFSDPIIVPNSEKIQPHGENLPKIIFKPNSHTLVFWGTANPNKKNKYSGRVYYTESADHGKSWTFPQPLVKDSNRFDQRYYDVALLPDGEIGVIWLDNRKTVDKEGSALYFARTSADTGLSNGKLISEPCCPCCRTDLYVDHNGNIHALFRGIVYDSIRDMVHIVSSDGGKTFSGPKRISEDNWVLNTCPHTGPAMTENENGLHFAWYTGGLNPGSFYTSSTDNGQNFKRADPVSAKGSHPQLATMPNGTVVIVWDESEIKNNKVQKRIGMQLRNNRGEITGKEFISPVAGIASFPVLSPLDRNSLMVAYTIKNGDKNYVSYQRAEFSTDSSY